MKKKYYAGHSFNWMNYFINAIPANQGFVKCIAVCVAEAIHHQCIYTKQPIFSLSHSVLDCFGIDRRSVKQYLLFFQKAKLIKVSFKQGASPKIKLLLLPYK